MVECPRDAMQGWQHFIPTSKKVEYINSLLQVGFDIIDFGSFVSAKAIPQMADTKEVIVQLKTEGMRSKLLAIVANLRGAEDACEYEHIAYVGFPFSVSETFQKRNTNSSIDLSFQTVERIREHCMKKNRELVVYISMGFGNPYGDIFSEDIVFEWVNKLAGLEVKMISLADTVGLASPELVYSITKYLVDSLPGLDIGVHLHSSAQNRQSKLEAALRAGSKRFDGALKGFGGCPMADDKLVGNMDTEWMISYFQDKKQLPELNKEALQQSLRLAEEIFVSSAMVNQLDISAHSSKPS